MGVRQTALPQPFPGELRQDFRSGHIDIGGTQVAGTITWVNQAGAQTVDTIRFQTAVATPEPASLLLLPAGLGVLAVLRKRRLPLN